MSSDDIQTAGTADDAAEVSDAGNAPEAADETDAQARIAELERALEAAGREAEAAREASLRAVAEADNVRKRAGRDLENAHKFALDRFVAELLPVKDGMELGLAAEGADAAQLREGMEMTLRMLATAVEKPR